MHRAFCRFTCTHERSKRYIALRETVRSIGRYFALLCLAIKQSRAALCLFIEIFMSRVPLSLNTLREYMYLHVIFKRQIIQLIAPHRCRLILFIFTDKNKLYII